MTLLDFADRHWLVSLIVVLSALGSIDIIAMSLGGKFRQKD